MCNIMESKKAFVVAVLKKATVEGKAVTDINGISVPANTPIDIALERIFGVNQVRGWKQQDDFNVKMLRIEKLYGEYAPEVKRIYRRLEPAVKSWVFEPQVAELTCRLISAIKTKGCRDLPLPENEKDWKVITSLTGVQHGALSCTRARHAFNVATRVASCYA